MAVLDKNELFYTALQIAISQEKDPYWIFKTNLLHIDNIATNIYSDNLIRPSINLDSIYEYIDESLPFHDRFENYAIQYNKNDEVCEVEFEEEHTFTIQIGYENVSEYPTVYGYDTLPYDFEYPGIGLSGSNYEILYNPNYGLQDIINGYPTEMQVSGWYPFKNPIASIYSGRNRNVVGSVEEDPLCAVYDYQPSYQQFEYVLECYNQQHKDNPLSMKELITKYYNDPYYFDNTANFVYILNQDKTFEWVRDQLFNGFKGLQVHGGKTGSDSNGYDVNDYDSNLYDYITYETKYYITDGKPADWFLVEKTKFNENAVIPTNTTRFYTPEAPFATKKLEVYITDTSNKDSFNLFGNAYIENNTLYNFQNTDSYAALKNLFNVGYNSWEINITVHIDKFVDVIYNNSDLYKNKVIPIFGSLTNKYLLPQLYVVGETVYFDASTNRNNYDIQLSLDGIKTENTYKFTVGYDRSKYYLKVDGIGEVSYNSRTPLYINNKSVLRIGNSAYNYEIINYIPEHYIGGVFSYRGAELPYINYDENYVYVPALTIIYSDGLDENNIQKLSIGNTQGNQEIISYLTINETTSLFVKNITTNSNISFDPSMNSGLIIYYGGNISLEENASYIGKYNTIPSSSDIKTYPCYYFDTRDDMFYKKTSTNSNWVKLTQFTIIGEIRTSSLGEKYIVNYVDFSNSPDIRYLYQNATIDLESFQLSINGYYQAPNNTSEKHLWINRDYTVGIDGSGKEYISLLDDNKNPKTLKEGTVLRIDCLDYDYLYDIIYANKANSSNEFMGYKQFLGSFPSVEALVQKYGTIKVKYKDYFYNTTTKTEWIFNPINMDLTEELNPEDYQIDISLENINLEIYTILGIEFGWGDTGMPYGSIRENDLFNLRGTKLLRPDNTAKGSEEIKTAIHDGVIIDVYESSSYIDSKDVMVSPHSYIESVSMGKNKVLKIEPFTNNGILKFVNGRYESSVLKWKSRTSTNPWPNTELNVMTDVTSNNTVFIEVEKDILEILEEKHLYGQTSNSFSVSFTENVDPNLLYIIMDGKLLNKENDYSITINDKTVNVSVNETVMNDGKKHCFSLYMMKSNNFSQVYEELYTENPYTIKLPNSYMNPAVLNTFMLFDSKGKRLKPPFIKWYYLESDTNTLLLPINNSDEIDITDVQVWLTYGKDVQNSFKIRQGQYRIENNNLVFNRNIPSGVTISIIIPHNSDYNIYFTYDNGNYLIDYDLDYVIDYELKNIVDYGHYYPGVTGTAIIYVEEGIDVSKLIFISNALNYNYRLDCYQARDDNQYIINSDYFDMNSVCVWRNGILVNPNEYSIYNNTVFVNSLNTINDVIQIWYKVNRSVNYYEHDKIILSDTNQIYNLKNIPMSRVSLVYPLGYNDIKIYVDNANYLSQPYIDASDVKKSFPGRIQIENEIIEFWSVDLYDHIPGTSTSCHSLSGLVRGILGSSDASSEHPYKVGTLIDDIGMRYETLLSHTKNKDSRIDYLTVRENWEDPIEEYGRYSLMPWYNIPGEVKDVNDITVWKTEWIKVAKDYTANFDYLTLEKTDSIIYPSPFVYTSPIGNYTYDINLPIDANGMYYKTGIINDIIGIRLYNTYNNITTGLFQVNGDLNTVAKTINNMVDNSIMQCRCIINEEINDNSYLQFNIQNGYSMELYDSTDTNAQSYFIQEVFGGILKSTKNAESIELTVGNGNGISIIGFDRNIYSIEFKSESNGKSTIELLVDDINSLFKQTRIYATIKTNPFAENIRQLYLINYANTDATIDNISVYNNLDVLGLTPTIIGCPVITDGNGRLVVNNTNKGKIAIDNKFYDYESVINTEDENGQYTNLTGINIPFDIKAGEEYLGSKFILQTYHEDYDIDKNAVVFYKRQKMGTLIRIQNKDIYIDINKNHNHYDK